MPTPALFSFFFFNDTATTEIYTLSLHDALPIWEQNQGRCHAVSEPVYAADQFQPHQSVAASEGLSGPCAGGFLPGVPLGCCCLGMGLRSILRPQPSGEAIADQLGRGRVRARGTETSRKNPTPTTSARSELAMR